MEEYDKRIFSNNLNKCLRDSGKRQTDLCDLLHVSKSTVSSWCNAQKIPRMDKIEALSNYFGVLKSDLIEEKPTPVSESGLSDPVTAQIMDIICQMSPEEKRLYLENLKTLRLLQEQGRKPEIQE